MGVTAIKRLENRTQSFITLFNIENPNTLGHGVQVPPGGSLAVDMWIPWANGADFPGKHLRVDIVGQSRFWIWQAANADGDHIRHSRDGLWHDKGERVDGISAVDGDRTLVVFDAGPQLLNIPQEVLDFIGGLVEPSQFRLLPSTPLSIPSVPSASASAFSVAGPASDAWNCVYKDSGKRYEFTLENGIAWARHPDGSRTALTAAVTYANKRVGESFTVPPLDLITASGSRVFAKARGQDRFFFTTMDKTFVHCTPRGAIDVPSTYFKLDPEHGQPGARKVDLTAHVDGTFAHHPAAERFPLYRALLEQELLDLMIVRVRPRVWHELDSRPPRGAVGFQLALVKSAIEWVDRLLAIPFLDSLLHNLLTQAKDSLQGRLASAHADSVRPPDRIPAYNAVTYQDPNGQQLVLPAIKYRRVVDIGVGHVHDHEQYEKITGGEMQPVLKSDLYANGYQLFNGPERDGDGYIDGTCNFYALVELDHADANRREYALLFQDEQSYFTQRWRLVDWEDTGGLALALITDLFPGSVHDFDRAAYWCPFRQQHIGPKSRMAVAAQVILVTGDADRGLTRSRLYSINFSWSTMDRTWRWRDLPLGAEVRYFDATAEAAGSEPIAASAGDAIYPQTVRLREDMTLHLKGRRHRTDLQPAEEGRWYQRYLPPSNQLPTGGFPPRFLSDTHEWKFLPEHFFQLADRFSHFGVYDTVDSRMQYYVVLPASATDEQALAAVASGGHWVDGEFKLYRWAPKFSWAAPMHLLTPSNLIPGVLDRRPPSLFNSETKLRIVRRGGRWLAMHADKRDDELLPFGGPFGNDTDFSPIQVTLAGGGRSAALTLQSHTWLRSPLSIERAELWWTGETGAPATVRFFPSTHWQAEPFRQEHLWRVRIAALVPGQPGSVVRVLDGDAEGRLQPLAGTSGWEFRWTPDATQAGLLRTHCLGSGPRDSATSLWFEDVTGHVSVPGQVRWLQTPVQVLAIDRIFTVREADSLVDTGITLQPGDDYAFDASGSIWAGVLFTGENGPAGWNNVDHDPKFPLHDGPDAHPFSLIGRFGSLPWFYVGDQRPRMGYASTNSQRLYLRTNDDAPGNGNGQFSCLVRVWRMPLLTNDATFVSQSVPSLMVAGRTYDVELRVRNAGTATWTWGTFRLGSQNPENTGRWGVSRLDLPYSVAPGQEVLLRFQVKAPTTPGVHVFQWRMLQEGLGWFGESTPPVLVSVPGVSVSYGTTLKLRHFKTGCALHSHPYNYGHPGTSGQQQVTCSAGYDDDDLWRIKPAHGQPEGALAGQPVQHGATVRLEHVVTRKNLHSHGGIPSPVTGQQEVTGYGTDGVGDSNDNWRVELDGAPGLAVGGRVRLVHVNTNHALHSHPDASHPEWTRGQQEVTGFGSRDENDIWWVSEARVAPAAAVTYGAMVRMRHVITDCALHSHPHNYGHPGTSGQQQVTCFAGTNDDDFWRIKAAHGQPDEALFGQPVQHGAIVRLEHVVTRRNLHSHSGFPSPVTGQQEVTGAGEDGFCDTNDNWRVELEAGTTWTAGARLRLVHVNTNHALHSHGGFSHPDWTWGQQEVTGFGSRDENDIWRVTDFR